MPESQIVSRRHADRVRRIAAAVAALVVAGLAVAPAAGAFNVDDTLYSFKTLPASTPEKTVLVTRKSTASAGKVFLTAKRNVPGWQMGPTILDENAKILWYKPMQDTGKFVLNTRPQTYHDRPVVTWWEGTARRGFGAGQGEIYDTNYQHVATVKAGNGYDMDLHEFTLTPQGTALILAYKAVPGDTTSAPGGGRKDGLVHENVMQEVDVETGKVLVQWVGSKDISFSESWNTVPKDPTIPYDYMHLNSVDLTKDGNIVISARATHAYYKINRKTGKLMWRMGGKKSDFKMTKGSRTAFQHDVHQLSPNFWSAYDNNADEEPAAGAPPKQSRGVILKVDEKRKTVQLRRQFVHPKKILAVSQGNMQTLAGGHAFIGWGGDRQNMTEFDSKGRVVWDARLLSTATDSYRAFKAPWVGTPTNKPLIDAAIAGNKVTVSMSWNGATEINKWRVLAGPADGQLTKLGEVAWKDLETAASFTTSQPMFQVEALGRDGSVLARSVVEAAHS